LPVGKVGWNLAGSRVVESFIFGAGGHIFVDGFIEDGVLFSQDKPLEFGKGILKEFGTKEKFDQNISETKRALNLAVQADEALMIFESQTVFNTLLFVKNLKLFVDLFRQPNNQDKLDQLKERLDTIDEIAKKLIVAIAKWGKLVNPSERNRFRSRFLDSVDFAATIAGQLRTWVNDLDIADPYPNYRFSSIGNWNSEDFKKTTDITVWSDVTEKIKSTGEYDVRLFFQKGASGVEPKAVTLLAGPTKETAKPISTDRWDSRLSRYGRYTEYWIKVPERQSNIANSFDRYFIKAEITGPSLELPKERRTTNGEILIRKSWRDAEL